MTDYIIGLRLGASGEEIASANSVTSKFIDVSNIEKFYTGAYAYGSICGYDRDFKFVKVLQSNGEFDGSYVVDQNVQYIRLSFANQSNYKRVFLYTDEAYLSQKTNIFNATYHEYGITSTDLKYQKELDVIPSKMDDYHTLYMNSLNMFIEDMIQERGYALKDDGINTVRSAAWWYTKFIPVTEGWCISSNLPASGNIFFYDKDKTFISSFRGTYTPGRRQDNVLNGIVPEGAYYARASSNWDVTSVFLNVSPENFYRFYPFGEVLDFHYKYRNKKLVTIGDSITYQASWQERLCELTGMWYNRKEVRGDNEAVKTEGYGYIKLGTGDADTDEYFETVEGITKTSETIVDGFGYAHPVWKDTSGNRYRQPCRTAEGGETVMPVNSTSIYSRAADSKYYKGDVIIVFAGANDKTGYCQAIPTVGLVKDRKGMTNLLTDESNSDSTYEIYTEDMTLEETGDYSDQGVTTGVKKYNHTFRACFRGLLKKIVDGNPNAEIIVIGPFSTFVKAHPYVNRGYDYLTAQQNDVIKEAANDFSCRYIDLSLLFGRYNAADYFGGSDGTVFIHPNGKGGKKIADYIHSQLC